MGSPRAQTATTSERKMLHLRSLFLLLLVATQVFGVATISRRTTHSAGQVLLESDLNLDNDHLITAINLVIVKFPGDTVKSELASIDTLVANTIRMPGSTLRTETRFLLSALIWTQ